MGEMACEQEATVQGTSENLGRRKEQSFKVQKRASLIGRQLQKEKYLACEYCMHLSLHFAYWEEEEMG